MPLTRSPLDVRSSPLHGLAASCAVAALLAPHFAAQVQAWASTHPSGSDSIAGVRSGASGESYVYTQDVWPAQADTLLLRYGAGGQLDWSASQSSASGWVTLPARLALAPSGAVAVGATRVKFDGSLPSSFIVAMYSAAGALSWQTAIDATPGAVNQTALRGLGVDASGRVYASGTLYPGATAKHQVTTCALANDGALLWTRHLGDDLLEDYGGPLAVVPGGGVVVTGSVDPIAMPSPSIWRRALVASYDASGALQWERRYPPALPATNAVTMAVDVERAANGDVYVLAQAATWGTAFGFYFLSNSDVRLIKYDAQGALLWERTYGESPTSQDRPVDLTVDAAGRATIVGSVELQGTSGYRAQVVQYDVDGTLRFARTWAPAFGQLSSSLDEVKGDSLGRVLAAGLVKWPEQKSSALLLCYDAQGELVWMRGYPEPAAAMNQGQQVLDVGAGDVVTLSSLAGYVENAQAHVVRYASSGFQAVGAGSAGTGGAKPALAGSGPAQVGTVALMQVSNGVGGALAVLGYGVGIGNYVQLPLLGGTLYVLPSVTQPLQLGGASGVAGAGSASVPLAVPSDSSLVGIDLRFQAAVLDAGAAFGVALSNAVEFWIG
jgi:hypothetical protein